MTLLRANSSLSPGLISGLGGSAGFGENVLSANDDESTALVDITGIFEGGLNFFGTVYNGFYVNNNGSVTFGFPRAAFTPDVITGTSFNPEITPYFADVDTRGGAVDATPGGNSTGSNLVYWDFDTVNDRIVVTWDDVGYYSSRTDLLNAFQLILTDRGDGDFDIEFRYEDVNWTTGEASGGVDGLGGTVARAGWTSGTGAEGGFFELPQSGNQAEMLALDQTAGNTGLVGIWQFFVRNGGVVERVVPLPTEDAGAWVVGDPHLLTLDGVNYSFQATGEYVLTRSTVPGNDFEIQARFVPVPGTTNASQTEAIATRTDGGTVMIDGTITSGSPVLVNGVTTEVPDFGSIGVGNDRIFRENDTYTIVYAGADGTVGEGDSQLAVIVRDGRVDMSVAVSDTLLGQLEGLLGDGDGNPLNDVARADGTVLPRPLTGEDLYGGYRDDWRITTTEDSLFVYASGESPGSFYDPDFPDAQITLADLTEAERSAAIEAATNAGLVQGTPNFDNAVLDFALTGDASFLQSSATVPVTFGANTPSEGADVLFGSTEGDTLDGLAGDDSITADGGNDTVIGGAGNDTLNGNDGNDSLTGGDGNDGLRGQAGDDTLEGGDGNDNLAASTGNDLMNGGAGDDLMGGGEGNDTMDGGAGADFMGGGLGDDSMLGGAGDDVVNGGAGADTLEGGDGNDIMGASFQADRVVGGDGNDDMGGGSGRDTIVAGAGNDSVGGGEAADDITGGTGNDFLAGGLGNDTITGGAGADTLNGGGGDDSLTGGADADRFVFNMAVAGGSDVITDFADGVDEIRIRLAPGEEANFAVTSTSGGAVLTFTGHEVLLEGVAASAITAEDITFV